MKRSELKRNTPMNHGTSTLKRSPMSRGMTGILRTASFDRAKPRNRTKRSRPKMTPIRASAKDQACTLRFRGICRNRRDTTVWCHSNSSIDGKGAGIKARDEEGCYGCFECHCYLDGGWVQDMDEGMTREKVDSVFDRARQESQAILRKKGLLKEEQC